MQSVSFRDGSLKPRSCAETVLFAPFTFSLSLAVSPFTRSHLHLVIQGVLLRFFSSFFQCLTSVWRRVLSSLSPLSLYFSHSLFRSQLQSSTLTFESHVDLQCIMTRRREKRLFDLPFNWYILASHLMSTRLCAHL